MNTAVIPSEHLAMIRRIAYRLAARLPASVEVEDLISDGVIGYLEALPRYRPELGSIETFVRSRVKGAMLDGRRKMDLVPRLVRKRQHALEKAERRFCNVHGRRPDRDELAQAVGFSVEEVGELQTEVHLVSIDGEVGGQQGVSRPLHEVLADPATPFESMEELVDLLRSAGRIDRAIRCLAPRDQAMIRQYFFEERNQLEIADGFGVTESRLSQLMAKALRELKRILTDLDRADALVQSAGASSPMVEETGGSEFDALGLELERLIRESGG